MALWALLVALAIPPMALSETACDAVGNRLDCGDRRRPTCPLLVPA